jgi:hypothetical protein
VTERHSADLLEYETLRQEINNRTTISYTLVALDLAALGGGLSVVDKSRAILAGLAVISTLLWLYWTDHAFQVQRIASYIAISLAPKISAEEGHAVLQWEVFLRRLTAGGMSAQEALFGPGGPIPKSRFRPIVSSDWYTTLLFGGSPPLLLALYIAANVKANTLTAIEVGIASAAVAGLWTYALINYRRMKRTVPVLAEAILAANDHNERGEELIQKPESADFEGAESADNTG